MLLILLCRAAVTVNELDVAKMWLAVDSGLISGMSKFYKAAGT